MSVSESFYVIFCFLSVTHTPFHSPFHTLYFISSFFSQYRSIFPFYSIPFDSFHFRSFTEIRFKWSRSFISYFIYSIFYWFRFLFSSDSKSLFRYTLSLIS